jgi:hypothetical protein
MKNVEAAGGKVLSQPIDIPHVGTMVTIADSEGNNKVSLLLLSILYNRLKVKARNTRRPFVDNR